MCTNKIKIYNRFTHRNIYVDCGKCPACLAAKANKRRMRIYNSYDFSDMVLFVTLTYAPIYLPYIKPEELHENVDYINIYRDYDVRKVRMDKSYRVRYKHYKRDTPLATVDCFDKKVFYDGSRLPLARGSKNKVGVLFFKDLQDFCKRLERNLSRHYGISGSDYKMFKVSELGETYFRPHFHLLVHIKKENMAQFYDAIRKSWPFDNQGLRRQIEVARSAASYVSKYVCCGSDVPDLFKTRPFKPKASFSRGYGFFNHKFSLPSLLDGIERGSLMYSVFRNNTEDPYVDLFYPKYFIDRYFIKFKGFSRLSSREVFDLVRFPNSIYRLGDRLGYVMDDDDSRDDYSRFLRCVRLRFRRFCEESGFHHPTWLMTRLFAYYYSRVWTVYASNIYREMFKDGMTRLEMLELYDNLDEVRSNSDQYSLPIFSDLAPEIQSHPEIENPNLFHSVISRTQKNEDEYFTHLKKKKTNNHIYQSRGMWI